MKSIKIAIFSLCIACASLPAFSIDAYTIIIPQVDPTGNFQISRLIAKPSEEAYLRYNYTTDLPMWEAVSSMEMYSTQISDTSAVGRELMTADDEVDARSAIGAGTSDFDGAYTSLTGQPTNLNQFTNGPGFITASTAPVTSVNGFTGGVTLTAASVGAAASAHTHTASQLSDGTSIGRSLFTAANQAAVQSIVGVPSAQVNSDWSASSGVAQILNKPAKYSGTTSGSGIYSVTYGSAYSVKPHLVFSVEGGTNKDTAVLTSTSTTGFSIIVERRSDVLGLLPSYSPVSGITVNVTVTQ